jgi:hypothetical protein
MIQSVPEIYVVAECGVVERVSKLCLFRRKLVCASHTAESNTYHSVHSSLAEQGVALRLREVYSSSPFWNCQCRFSGADEAARLHLCLQGKWESLGVVLLMPRTSPRHPTEERTPREEH